VRGQHEELHPPRHQPLDHLAHRRRLYRAHPQLRERAAQIRAAQKSHKKTKPLIDEQQAAMLRLLREGN
jgi:hypothetical protein